MKTEKQKNALPETGRTQDLNQGGNAGAMKALRRKTANGPGG